MDRYCIIGAGPCGLTAAKNFQERGIAFDVLERSDLIGGLWNYGAPHGRVYKSTHLISSKRMTQFTDFPFPDDYPDYPHHTQVLAYMHSYADRFNLRRHIHFRSGVERAARAPGGWRVHLSSGEQREYRGLVIATGHLWSPRLPPLAEQFTGESLHSAYYRTPDILRDKTVLVVGAGNSGCDIAVEATQHAARTLHSMRRGYHFIPKYVFGRPADEIGDLFYKLRLPMRARRTLGQLSLIAASGRGTDFGLQAPDHRLFETHPIINSQMLYHLGHGDIQPRPDVTGFDGQTAIFADGARADVDLVVWATGYDVSIPFVAKDELAWRSGAPDLFLHVFHPQRTDIFCLGMIQANGGLYGLADRQAQLVARYIQLRARGDEHRLRAFEDKKRACAHDLSAGQRYVRSTRHRLEVDGFTYRRLLERYLSKLKA